MSASEADAFPSIALSHFELFVADVAAMESFYSRFLGFSVTDRGKGEQGMVFMSRNPHEHHQLVLNPTTFDRPVTSPVDHISFRVESLADLRRFHESLASGPAEPQTVSHGTTWSIYFHDPEGNRLELFTDTPWHVDQPCRFEIDLGLDDAALIEFTRQKISKLPGFREVESWRAQHAASLQSPPTE